MLGGFCPNDIKFQLKKVQKTYLSWHWRVMQSLKNNWLLVPNALWCATFVENIFLSQKVMCHNTEEWSKFWRKTNFFIEKWQKMTWGIWKILRQAVESLKICTLMDHFCRNYVMLELNKYRGVLSWRMTCFQKWHK